MLDAYGLPLQSRATQEFKFTLARQGYEDDCLKRGVTADWSGLDADTQYLWFMTANALMDYRLEQAAAFAC